ncbi:MAG TPA: phosphatidylserine decarboxylase [Candidatus Acidoferrales bacterium]|nr:phosphatidylserine decarboxylase [Candidatus Acidoferrales bacterium]
MKYSGRAMLAALRLVSLAGAAVLVLLGGAFLAKWTAFFILHYLPWVLVALWSLFTAFTFYFFRDPDPLVPSGPNLVISPAHGKVDVIDTTAEPDYIGGECQRISVFLSVIDVHVQCAPLNGRVAFYKYTTGQFLSALKTESAQFNENLLIGFDASEPRGEKIGVRLIAGLIARRIVPWLKENDIVQRGERISLIQFGSRVEVYLPRHAKIKVKLGDRVVGGQTVIAAFD